MTKHLKPTESFRGEKAHADDHAPAARRVDLRPAVARRGRRPGRLRPTDALRRALLARRAGPVDRVVPAAGRRPAGNPAAPARGAPRRHHAPPPPPRPRAAPLAPPRPPPPLLALH